MNRLKSFRFFQMAIGIILLSFCFSCSIEHHLAKAQKHIDIAKRKGAIIKPDTVWSYNYTKDVVFDSITKTYKEILKKDSSITVINNTIQAGMTRQERLALEANFKHLEKMMKLQNDSLKKELNAAVKINNQNKKTERTIIRQEEKSYWPWVVIAICTVLIVFMLTIGKNIRL